MDAFSFHQQLLMKIWMVMIPFMSTVTQEVSSQFHSWGITSEMEELKSVGSTCCIGCHKLTNSQYERVSPSFNLLVKQCSGWSGFRLCTGVGGSLAEETAREGEEWSDRSGGGSHALWGEQQVWTKKGTVGTVEGEVCSESGECWIAHGKGTVDQIWDTVIHS